MLQFDIFTFVVKIFNVTVFFIVFDLCYTYTSWFAKFYLIKIRQKLITISIERKLAINPNPWKEELCHF